MSAVDLKVVCPAVDHGSHGAHGHSHSGHNHFGEIKNLIEASALDEWVKENSIRIFTRLAEAEAKVHGSTVEKVHFHEVGAIDSIVDIVGACIGFRYFKIDRFASSPLELGGGTVTFSHGTWPVPAPATAEIVKGFPVRIGGADAELTTPTGAAIITTLSDIKGIPDAFQIESTGLGAGDRSIAGIPNMLRLLFGKVVPESGYETVPGEAAGLLKDEVVVLETNIDDMLPENAGFLMERAMEEGALDVFFTPVFMKKNRPATQITVISTLEKEDRLVRLLFRNTTSLGIRRSVTGRYILEREIVEIDSELGKVRIKKASMNGEILVISPEYEDLKTIARKHDLGLDEVRMKIMKRVSDEDFQ